MDTDVLIVGGGLPADARQQLGRRGVRAMIIAVHSGRTETQGDGGACAHA